MNLGGRKEELIKSLLTYKYCKLERFPMNAGNVPVR